MRCAPTPPQCPLLSILIAVCVLILFSSDLFAACLQNLKCLCTILYCDVSPGVFNEIVYAL